MFQQFPPQAPQQDMMLLDRLRAQVEYYFSPQNLANDTFLRSLLYEGEHIGSVSLDEIAKFPMIKKLWGLSHGQKEAPFPSADPAFLARALQGSPVVRVSIDGKWISPHPTQHMHQQMPIVPVSYRPQGVLPPPNSSTHSAAGSSDESPPLRSIPSPSSPTSQTTATSSVGVPTHPVKEVPRVVFRNVPEGLSEEKVLNILSSPEAQFRPKAALQVGVAEWSISFETEEEAQRAIETLGPDSEIQAEIKTGLWGADPVAFGTPARPENPLAPHPNPQHQYQPLPMHPQFHYPVMAYPQGCVPYGVPFSVPPQAVMLPRGPPYGYAVPPPPPPSGMAGRPYVRYDAQPYPSHVYVRDTASGRGMGGRGNGGRGRRQRRSSRGDGFARYDAHDTQNCNHEDRSIPQSNKDDGNGGPSQYKKKKNFKGDGGNNFKYKANGTNSRGPKQSNPGKTLNEDQFPALADHRSGQAQPRPGSISNAAYAAALLKPMPPHSPSKVSTSSDVPSSPSAESTSQDQVEQQVGGTSGEEQLEVALSKMNVSSGNASESTDQQDGSPTTA